MLAGTIGRRIRRLRPAGSTPTRCSLRGDIAVITVDRESPSNAILPFDLERPVEPGEWVRFLGEILRPSRDPVLPERVRVSEGTLFPWVVSDFSLIDAIESGIVKVPRVPVDDNAMAGTMPTYRELWDRIREDLPKKGRGTEAVASEPRLPAELEGALRSLYTNYEKRFKKWQETQSADSVASDAPSTPPVFIVVCNNTNVSKLVFDWISGYQRSAPEVDGEDAPEGTSSSRRRAVSARPATPSSRARAVTGLSHTRRCSSSRGRIVMSVGMLQCVVVGKARFQRHRTGVAATTNRGSSMKPQPAYYSVHSTPDGTIVLAMPTRKPHRVPRSRKPPYDEDGCHNWFRWDWDDPGRTDLAKSISYTALACQLNLQKTVRAQIEPRLDAIEKRLVELTVLVDRLTAALTATAPSSR